jgi:hypothetical protein
MIATNVRVTADDYPEYGPGTVTRVDGRWAVVVFDNGAGLSLCAEDLTEVVEVTPIVGDPADIIQLLNAADGNDQDGEE